MMRRTRAQQIVAGALTFLILFALATPARAYVCAMHSGSGSAPNSGAHTGMSHHHSVPADDRTPQQCSCIGDCDAVATVHALPASTPAVPVAPSTGSTDRTHPEFVPRAMRAHFALPFANGPPIGA